ncbi:hypothetical protein BGZ70_007713 [Mortierella alpina]|uniref:Uncharacterized protein n=1 Tax=Mortierella alpina TaxID=64518 RepID=A0A9P6J7G1_MORAP|nr:hypothetical protein BGZ70_007713 [Mortierella alpina]
MKFIAIAAAVAISAVSAQVDEGRLFYSEPIGATVWTAGKNHTVSWTNACKDINTGKLDIVLYLGTPTSGTEQVRVPNMDAIGTLDCVHAKSAIVNLPANLTSSDKYSIHVDTAPLQSYSARFTIKGIEPVPSASPVAATSAGAAVPTAATTPAAPGATTGNSTKGNAAGSLKTLGSAAALLAAAVGSMLL